MARSLELEVGAMIFAATGILAAFIFVLGNFSLRAGFTRHVLDDAGALLAQVDAVRAMIANQEGSLHDPDVPEEATAIGKVLERAPWRIIAPRRRISSGTSGSWSSRG